MALTSDIWIGYVAVAQLPCCHAFIGCLTLQLGPCVAQVWESIGSDIFERVLNVVGIFVICPPIMENMAPWRKFYFLGYVNSQSTFLLKLSLVLPSRSISQMFIWWKSSLLTVYGGGDLSELFFEGKKNLKEVCFKRHPLNSKECMVFLFWLFRNAFYSLNSIFLQPGFCLQRQEQTDTGRVGFT